MALGNLFNQEMKKQEENSKSLVHDVNMQMLLNAINQDGDFKAILHDSHKEPIDGLRMYILRLESTKNYEAFTLPFAQKIQEGTDAVLVGTNVVGDNLFDISKPEQRQGFIEAMVKKAAEGKANDAVKTRRPFGLTTYTCF